MSGLHTRKKRNMESEKKWLMSEVGDLNDVFPKHHLMGEFVDDGGCLTSSSSSSQFVREIFAPYSEEEHGNSAVFREEV